MNVRPIVRPMVRAIARSMMRGTSSFDPLSFFADGTDGFWGDSTDSATLFEDAAGTKLADVSGMAGLRLDKSRGYSRGVVNLFSWSEDFTNGYWTKNGATVTTSAEPAPIGSGFADLLEAQGLTPAFVESAGVVFIQGGATISVYAKAGASGWLCLNPLYGQGAAARAWFDLVNGVTGATGFSVTSSRITDVGGGFFRCEVTANSADGSGTTRVFATDANDTVIPSGPASVYIFGAQIENGGPVPATAYQKKTFTLAEGGNHQYQTTTAAKPTVQIVDGVQALTLDSTDDAMLIDVPAGGWSGTFVQGTALGVIVGEIDVPAGPYQIPTNPSYAGPASDIHTVIVNRTLAPDELESLVEWVGKRCPVADFAGQNSAANWFRGRTDLTVIDVSRWDLSLLVDWSGAFVNTNLSQQSYTDLVTAIEAAGTSNGTLDITGGTSTTTGAAQTAALRGRGWTVTTPDGY